MPAPGRGRPEYPEGEAIVSRAPIVAIVGRTNVGKSSLFNRLAQRRLAVVDDLAGVTRDRVYAEADFEGRKVHLVDTGGLAGAREDELFTKVRDQAVAALAEADVILFVVDAQAGLAAMDAEVADAVRRAGKPVLLIANKAEAPGLELSDFASLGFGPPMPASAIHATGAAEIVDAVLELLPPAPEEEAEAPEGVGLAVIGRPNAGKSSLVNAIIGQERMIVSEEPGTTRDAVDTVVERDGRRFVLVDTAGLRRRFKQAEGVDYYAALRSLRAIERADAAALVIDAVEGPTSQDERLAAEVEEMGRGLVLCAHKWDLVLASALEDAEPKTRKRRERVLERDYQRFVAAQLPAVSHAPLIFTSAVTRQGIEELLVAAANVAEGVNTRADTSVVNRAVQDAVDRQSPPSKGGRALKILYATQVSARPPTVVLFVNDPALAPDSYRRHLEKALRDALYGPGVPVRLYFRARQRRERRGAPASRRGRR
jgi:GTP-binding protein